MVSDLRPSLSLSIQIDEAAGELPADRRQIRRWVQAALDRDAQLLLRFVGVREARELNARYRGRDKPTNVLTFGYEIDPIVQADIVICLAVLREEATRARLPLIDHLAHLVVHGVLHAQGQDHEDDESASVMERSESDILRRFGITDPYNGERTTTAQVRPPVRVRSSAKQGNASVRASRRKPEL